MWNRYDVGRNLMDQTTIKRVDRLPLLLIWLD
jgi:hypothetical protein